MVNRIQSIPIERLVAHPGNPNRMGSGKFAKLVRNIERTGLYEPLVVRPLRLERGRDARDTEAYEIINGHHRRQALLKLGVKRVDVVVWELDDEQADILLGTLNRLGGSDVLEKKLALLERLVKRMKSSELAKLLGQSARQIERLTSLARSQRGQACPERSRRDARDTEAATHLDEKQDDAPQCMVFFLNDEQKQMLEKAMSLAGKGEKTKAARNAAAITRIAEEFIN
jgi:ParB/RepB/Spo0J family partition protein